MKVIVPLAGKGTRLLPLTKIVPKPLVEVAGRPVMDYVMDLITGAGLEVEELIVITGHLKGGGGEVHVVANYKVPARFVEQKTLDGTAGAINLARPFVDAPVLIIFVDTLFDADLSLIKRADADGIIWAKEVDDYQRFGVVVHDAQGFMTKIVEKPDTPVSKTRQYRSLLHPRLEDALRRHRAGARESRQQGRVLPHRRVPVHGGPGQEDPDG